jgi:hypothetical protein
MTESRSPTPGPSSAPKNEDGHHAVKSRDTHFTVKLNRKRSRSIEALDAIRAKRLLVEETPIVTRDDKYYFEDGSCILQVESTLFNVCLALPFLTSYPYR